MESNERDDDAVVLVVICNGCGAEFDWRPGIEEETDRCSTCRFKGLVDE
jgi:hypothetical protein